MARAPRPPSPSSPLPALPSPRAVLPTATAPARTRPAGLRRASGLALLSPPARPASSPHRASTTLPLAPLLAPVLSRAASAAASSKCVASSYVSPTTPVLELVDDLRKRSHEPLAGTVSIPFNLLVQTDSPFAMISVGLRLAYFFFIFFLLWSLSPCVFKS